MLNNILSLLQQQATKLSNVENNQQRIPQIIQTHVQHGLQTVIHDEPSSQQRRVVQENPQNESQPKEGNDNKGT
jgi:hypothetical protein